MSRESISEIEREQGARAGAPGDVDALMRRLAASIDGAVIPGVDSRRLVAEALMRLALGLHLVTGGAHATRARLLAMALQIRGHDSVH